MPKDVQMSHCKVWATSESLFDCATVHHICSTKNSFDLRCESVTSYALTCMALFMCNVALAHTSKLACDTI